MTFRHRITLVATAAVAVAVLIASALTYLFVADQLHRQVDNSLRDTALGIQRGISAAGAPGRALPPAAPPGVGARQLRQLLDRRGQPAQSGSRSPRLLLQAPKGLLGENRGVFQALGPKGEILLPPATGVTLPVDARARKLARSGGSSYLAEIRIGSDHLRVLSAALARGAPVSAIQIARSLNEVDHTLSNLRLILALVAIGGIAAAALLGSLVSRATISPVRHLTEAVEHVTETQDLARRIPSGGGGELSRLAMSFNTMLDALASSMSALDASARVQRQLVADASHELRTPVTSLRANIEVLQQSPSLSESDRERLLSDVVEQLEDLTTLINDVIELARGDEPPTVLEEVRFDHVVAEEIARARRRAPGARITEDLNETLVQGDAQRLGRAVKNLIDNALKFGPYDGSVDVALIDGELTVRDHGPGIAAADMPHAFDRFYRGASARALPGSGLGLAIVRQVADAHGGGVNAEDAPGGGTLMRLRLSTLSFGAGETTDDRAPMPSPTVGRG
ncbi:MAG: two-component system, OmpR family, sensor histidine kinase MprB [Solirubrobacteraceae bacterium]|jgi:two-component system sensor histidine kinase MprB|nr:two-component system, OmpR family, sensor histidine kinase MprB [Solirubrobacteraceae bacterium]